jgi:hypothetical protein
VAIHDSKKEVDKDICQRRAQKIKAQADAATLRARQAQGNICADAAKPQVVLADHFARLDRQCEAMKEDIPVIKTSSSVNDKSPKSPNSTDADMTTSGNYPKAILKLKQSDSEAKAETKAA